VTVTVRHEVGTPQHVSVDMTTSLGSLTVPDPVFTASGCAAAGRELAPFNDLTAIGGVVTKSIQLLPRAGRATPRMAETASGMLNSIGLQGPGVDVFIKRDLGWLEEQDVRAVVSLAGSSVEDYQKLASKLRAKTLAMIEVNISCPNVDDRGQVFACDRNAAAAVISAVRRAAAPSVPVFAKLSPDVTDIVSIAKACVDAGANGLSLVNTSLGMVIDTETMRPALAGVTGGLSGPAIRPIALRCVWQVHEALPEVPLFGIGGIRTGLDAFQFILAGASAVQVGTVIFNDPGAPSRISRELREVLAARGMRSLDQAIGLAHREPELIIPEDPEPVGAQQSPIDAAAEPEPPEEVETVYIAPDVDEVFDVAAEDA
jgi:dihydroorotate dehydrogenase (NAD+) catalytic subunit